MSTDLFGLRVLDIDLRARRIRLRVFVTNYDTSSRYHASLPRDPSFFMRALATIDFHPERGITGSDSEARAFDERWVAEETWRWIEGVELLAEKNDPISDWSGICDVHAEESGQWPNEERLAQGDYDVSVSHDACLDDLRVGLSWATSAYETQSDSYASAVVHAMPKPGRVLTRVPLAEREANDEHPSREVTFRDLSISDDGAWLAAMNHARAELVILETDRWQVATRVTIANESAPAFMPGRACIELTTHDFDVLRGVVSAKSKMQSRRCGGSGQVRVEVGAFDDGIVTFTGSGATIRDEGYVSSVCVSPDDTRVLVGFSDERLQLHSLAEGSLLHVLEVPGWWSDVTWSPDGRWILVAYGAYERRGWLVVDAVSGARLATCLRSDREVYELSDTLGMHPVGPTPHVESALWDPKGRWLVLTRSSGEHCAHGPLRAWLEVISLS